MKELYQKIAELGQKYKASKIMLYGSRARGDNKERSDIDIAVFGMEPNKQTFFQDDIEKLPTLLEFDIAFITKNTKIEFLREIEKDGVILMYKYENLVKAVERLKEGIEEYNNNASTTIRDGVIQRFEFSAELAWKSMREYLLAEGYDNINSPKSTLKTAFADGIIDDEQSWLDLIQSRNLTSHLYDEAMADTIYEKIQLIYLPLFEKLIKKLQ